MHPRQRIAERDPGASMLPCQHSPFWRFAAQTSATLASWVTSIATQACSLQTSQIHPWLDIRTAKAWANSFMA